MRKRPSPKPSSTAWLFPAALGLLTLAAYANSFANGYAMDANTLILKDPRIRQVSAENLRLIVQNDYWWPTYTLGVYRPLTTLSYLLNWSVLGNAGDAAGYHVLNVLLHGVNVLLLYKLVRRLLPGSAAAFWAAALWAVHPVCVESVSSVSGRGDLLAAMSILAGLVIYTGGGRPMVLFAVALAGVCAKENAAVLIGLMLLWDLAFSGTEPRRDPLTPVSDAPRGASKLAMYGAAAAALALFGLARFAIYRDAPYTAWPVVDNPLLAAPFWTAKLTAIKVIGMDLALLIWPVPLACDRSYAQILPSGWSDPAAWLSLIGVTLLVAAAIVRRKRDPLMFLLAGLFAITLLPTANLLLTVGNIMAERFLYLPAAAFAIAIAALAYRSRAHPAILGVVVALLAARTIARNPAWKDNLALASADVGTAPRSFRVHEMLAQALHERDPRGNLDAAIREQERSWEIVKTLPAADIPVATPMNLGGYYLEKGDVAGKEWYEKAVAILLRGREISQAAERAWDDAQLAHGKPLRGRFATPNLFFNLGQAYGSLARYSEALEALRWGRAIDPAQIQFYEPMAAAYAALGERDQAAVIMEEKRIVEGGQSESCAAWADLAGAYRQARQLEHVGEVTRRAEACR